MLQQVLLSYVESLYPDAKGEAGCHVIIKLDSEPGHLDMNSLAELLCREVFLFPGVQNTTHVSQETDMNYGLFKSLLCQYRQVLMNDISNQNQQNEERIGRGIPSLDRIHCGVLLSG